MALMLLVGTSSAWADGFFDGLKVGYYPGTGNVDIWTGYNTSDIGTLSGQPYLKGVSVKTWQDNVTSVSIEIKNGNTTLLSATNATKISEWDNGNQVNWNKEWELLTNIALPKTSGAHTISVIAKTNFGTKVEYTLTYSIPCDNVDDSQIRIEIASATSYTKVYAWYDSNSELLGGWSGTLMATNGTSHINGQIVKYITISRNSVSLDKSVNIIFNNGGSSQSGNITGLKWGNIYYFDKNGGNMESKCLEPACETPDAPEIDESDTTCPNVNYTLPTATNKGSYTQKWYNSNGTEVTSPVKVSAQTKYTTKLINGTCESDATEFTLNVTSKPAAPSIEIGDANICAGQETYILVSSPLEGYTYKLYKNDTEVNGATLNNENKFIISEAGSYTVKVTAPQTACGLTSDPSQDKTLTVTSVTLALDPTSAPICSGTTLADIDTYVEITTNGDRVAWFEANSGGVALNEADEIRQTTYYAEATLNGCTSERVAFNVTELLNVPAKPVITPSDAAICSGNTVTLTLTEKVDGETYKIDDISVFTSSKTYTPTLNETTTYTITATNQCGSTNSELVTINVTTTPVITANKLVTTIGSPITLTSNNIDAIWTTTGGILNPNSGATSSVEFTSQNNGRYTITASNTANDITCSASIEVSVQNAFYVYIRRPKSGDNVYNDWYGKTNDAEKGNAPWFKEGTPNYDSMEETNYGGVGPVESFTDCNDYTWDAFEFAGGNFYIHAPNTGGSDGWATFTKQTYIESLSGDVYYYISSFTGGEQGSVLSKSATTPERAPEIITPVTSLNPASGILCSGSQATLTVTNPQNDYTYTLMYKGTAQGEPISGNNEVEFTVIEAGSYAVQAKVQSNSGCTSTASSSASQIKVIATDIKFDATEYTTTPWVPVTVVIEVPSGYEFTYNDATLTSITPEADKPIKKENGHEYTYTFPRPTDWGIGNSQSGDGYDEKPYTITATIKNAEQCGTATATVKLQDEGNDNCTLPNQ
ncbi:MAG: hypothetical protein IKJ22_01635 [Paludibacteraceae bacterium]|nr:hypothetical protein [Paludibacteraceae bacterium]